MTTTTVVVPASTPAVTVTVPSSAPTVTNPPPRATLPITGGEAWFLFWTALAIIAVGTALVSLARVGNRFGELT